jgi:hopanoid biosynthesis associated RND transporter like protein HpnN
VKRSEPSRSHPLFTALSSLTTTYARTIVVLVLVSCVVSIVYTFRKLDLVTSRSAMISPGKRYFQLNEEYSDIFYGLGQLVVVAEGRDPEETKTFVRRLGERLAADPIHVAEVFYQIDTTPLHGKKLLFLSPADLRTLRENVEEYQDLIQEVTTRPGLNTLFASINRKISEAMVSHLAAGFLGLDEPADTPEKEEPLSLSFIQSVLEQVESGLTAAAFRYRSPWADFFGSDDLASDGMLTSQDERFVFLLVEPQKGSAGFTASQQSIQAVRQHIAALQPEFPAVQAGVTGEKALENDEMLAAQTDTGMATFVSLGGIAVLYLVFFLSIRRPLIILVTLIVGLIWAMGAVTLTVGHLSILSVFVAPLLIGLSDDFCVHFVTRYEEERDQGAAFHHALYETFIHTAPGVVAAACTTALACYAMMVADFRGIQELGLITGNGILLALVATLVFLPALMTVLEGKQAWSRSYRRGTWLARGFSQWGLLIQRYRRQVLLVTAGVSLLCLFALPTVTFDYNLLNLQAQGTESVTWELRIIANSERSSWYALDAVSSVEEATRKAAHFEALPTVERVESIASLIPEGQEERIQLVRQLAEVLAERPSTLPSPEAVAVGRLQRTLESIRFKLREENEAWDPERRPAEQEIAEVRRLLTRVLAHLETLPPEEAAAGLDRVQQPLFHDFANKWALLQDNLDPAGPLTLADVPPQLKRRFVSADGQRFLLQIYPHQNIWERESLEAFIEQLRQVEPDVTGSPVTSYESIQAIKSGFIEGGLYATIAILFVTFLTLRSVTDTLLAALPVGLGMLWMVGLMWVWNLQFNLANLMTVPLVVGVGIENGIHLVRRARKDACEGWELVGKSTGQGVALFSLTSMIGLGSLMVARHYGIFSMGLLLTLALGSVLLISLSVLPLLLHAPAAQPLVQKGGREQKDKTVQGDETLSGKQASS